MPQRAHALRLIWLRLILWFGVGAWDSNRLRCVLPGMITAVVALFAVLLLAFTLQDSFEVMLLPRRVVR